MMIILIPSLLTIMTLAGMYLLAFSIFMKTPNLRSALVFRVVPFLIAMVLFYYSVIFSMVTFNVTATGILEQLKTEISNMKD